MTPNDQDQSRENAPAIEFRHASLSFEGRPALCDVSLKAQHGEMVLVPYRA